MADLTFRLVVKDDGSAVVENFADTVDDTANKADRSTKKMNKGFESTTKSIKTSALAVAALGIAITGLGVIVAKKFLQIGQSFANTASDFEESSSKFNVVFSSIANEATTLRNNLAQNFGLSTAEATKLLGATGDLLTGFGFTQKESLKLSNQVNELAVDLASFTNIEGGAARASDALTRALLGERESLKSLGISVNENNQLFKDAVKEILQTTDVTLFQAKALATLRLATIQSKNAIGDFARTQEQLANQQRILTGRFEDLRVEIGQALIPVFKRLTTFAVAIVNRTIEWAKANKEAISAGFKNGLAFIIDSFKLIVRTVRFLVQTFFVAKVAFNTLAGFVVEKAADMVTAFRLFRGIVQRIFLQVGETIASVFETVLRKAGELAVNFKGNLGKELLALSGTANQFRNEMRFAQKELSSQKAGEFETTLRNLAAGFRKTADEAVDTIIKVEEFGNVVLRTADKLKGIVLQPEIKPLVAEVPPITGAPGGLSEVEQNKQRQNQMLKDRSSFISDFFGLNIGLNKKLFDENLSFDQRMAAAKTDLFQSLGQLAASQASKDFETQKKFQIAGAIASTFAGAARALELPWPLNLIAFASVVAQGLAAVSNIKKTKPGSSAGGGGGGGGGAIASPQIPDVPRFDDVPDVAENVIDRGPDINITIQGFVGDEATLASALGDLIREAVGDDVDFGVLVRGG